MKPIGRNTTLAKLLLIACLALTSCILSPPKIRIAEVLPEEVSHGVSVEMLYPIRIERFRDGRANNRTIGSQVRFLSGIDDMVAEGDITSVFETVVARQWDQKGVKSGPSIFSLQGTVQGAFVSSRSSNEWNADVVVELTLFNSETKSLLWSATYSGKASGNDAQHTLAQALKELEVSLSRDNSMLKLKDVYLASLKRKERKPSGTEVAGSSRVENPATGFTDKKNDSSNASRIPSLDEDRLFLTDPRGIKVMGKAPAEYVSEQFGKSWAVVIGIDDYEKAPRLKYATADAKAMTGVLQQQGFQVAALYNQQATKAAIERELGDKLIDRVGENDRVVIFYAGHGETKTARGGKTMGYLLPVQGQQDALSETGISMGRIKELADALPSKQVLFLVDVCYGGIAGQQFRSTLPPMTVAYLKMITRERGRQLISAGGPDQQAMESPEWGHSVFTYYLLEGLKGLADLNDDGIIPASELYSYLDSRVFAAAQMKGHTQRPELWSLAAEKGEFVFVPSKKKEQNR